MHDTHHSQLLAAGAKVDQPNKDGGTPLIIATEMGHVEVVKEVGWSCQSQDLDGNDG